MNFLFLFFSIFPSLTSPSFASFETIIVDEPSLKNKFGDVTSGGTGTTAGLRSEELSVEGVDEVKDLVQLSASLQDSYNAEGYSQSLSVRGFPLDSRNNYYRNGLPVFGDAPLFSENKESVQLLKGVASVWTGVGSPGGIINLKTLSSKTEHNQTDATLLVNQFGGTQLGVDFQFPVRSQISLGLTRSSYLKSEGRRNLIAVQYDGTFANFNGGFEIEVSEQSARSRAPFSLWADKVPEVPSPRTNFNSQSWSEPVVFSQKVGTAYWQTSHFFASFGLQEIILKDRIAFAYGCSRQNLGDRFCDDGAFDQYDYRSEDEKKWSGALKLAYQWEIEKHLFSLVGLTQKSFERADWGAYNFVGENNSTGSLALPADPSRTDNPTQRNSDRRQISFNWETYWSAPFKSLFSFSLIEFSRESSRIDGTRPTGYTDHQLLPFLGLEWSHGNFKSQFNYTEGVETFVTPNRSSYEKPGSYLRDGRTKLTEVSLFAGDHSRQFFEASLFEIKRPRLFDSAPDFTLDGEQVHSGLEAGMSWKLESWSVKLSSLMMNTKLNQITRETQLNGKKPVNVAENSARINIAHFLNPFTHSFLVEVSGAKFVDTENKISIPSWTVAHFKTNYTITDEINLSLSVENLFDHRYWRESPTQFGHIYLLPGNERRLELQLQAKL